MAIEQTVKQRLIGAIVLVALAVILLPGILGQKTKREPFVSKVPPVTRPLDLDLNAKLPDTTTSQEEAKPSDRRNTDHASNAKSTNTKQTTAQSDLESKNKKVNVTSTKSDPENQIQQEITPKKVELSQSIGKNEKLLNTKKADLKLDSWVVQVGSFSSHTNAELLANRLEEQRMKAFVRPVNFESEQTLYRVFVGPWLTKEQAEKNLPQIENITRLKPIVISWQADKH